MFLEASFNSFGCVVDVCKACTRREGKPCTPCSKYLRLQPQITNNPQQNQLGTSINASHEIFIHHFPIEIATYVFELSLPPVWDCLPAVGHTMTRAEASSPLVLAAVCSTWRKFALSTPRLWTTLPITLSPRAKRMSSHCDLVQEWIQRSKALPLSIWFAMSTLEPEIPTAGTWAKGLIKENKDFPKLMTIINDSSLRWQNLNVDASCWSLGLKFLFKLGKVMPNLDRVRILDAEMEFDISESENLRPSPTFVSFTSNNKIDINWSKITDLEWEWYSVDQFLDVLPCATGLVNCTIHDYDEEDFNSNRQAVVCDTIRSLNIIQNVTTEHFLPNLLTKLRLPQLRNLDVCYSYDLLSIPSITEFISRSGCLLTSISLHFGDAVGGEGNMIRDLLKQTPHLIHCNLFQNHFGADEIVDMTPVFKLLAETSMEIPTSSNIPHRSNFKFVSHLESLVMQGVWQVESFTWKTITDIFGCAAEGNPVPQRPLSVLKMIFEHTDLKPVLPALHNILDGGSNFRDNFREELGKKFTCYMDGEDLMRFVHVGHSGVALDIQLPPGKGNALKSSAKYLNIAPNYFD